MTTVAETQVAGKGRLEMPNAAPFDHPVHFTDLDGLRGILALSVVLLHYGINAAVQRVSHGHLAGFTFQLSVDFFFILSGFVLAYSMRDGRVSVPGFAVKRIFRLMPVHFFCLAILLLISAVAPGQLPYLGKPLPTSTVVADLVLATPIIWPGRDAINVPSWSVGWELYLPILAVVLAPIMAPVARRFGLLIVLLGCCALSFTAIGVAEGGHLYGARAFLGLSTGACLYGVAVARSAHLRGATTGILYALIAGMLVVMLVSGTTPYVAALFPWLAVFTVLCGTRTRSLLSSGPIAWLGEISYTLYMVHIPVFVGVALLVGARLSGSIPLKGAAILLALLGAHLLTRWVERPAMALGRRLRRPPAAPTADALVAASLD